MDSRPKIRQFIKENFLFTDDDGALADGDSLMMKGVIDSTGALEVIMFLEESFGFEVGEEEMIPENLDSVDNLVEFVKRKAAAA